MKPSIGPRRNARLRARVFRIIYGGDQDYFKRLSPWALAERNRDRVLRGMHIRLFIGGKDATLQANIKFHEHLVKLNIPHIFKILFRVRHNLREMLKVLSSSEKYWRFYRKVLGPCIQEGKSK